MSKKALIVGINDFTRPHWRLRGCINDTIEMQGLLKTYFGFQDEGVKVLQAALARDRLGEFQAQAAIAALHADAPTAEETDWVQIVEWYDELARLTESPVVRLNRAVAVGEADGTTSLAVTLLRAVGWLSRGDLALRPVHAGPAIATPGAQVPGRHRAELCFRLHAAGEPARALEAQRYASPALLFAGGSGAGPLGDGARLLEVDDPEVIVSAVEPRREQGAVIRLYNASAEARRIRVRWGGPRGSRLEALDLAGRPDAGVRLAHEADGAARLGLRAWQIVSLRPL